MPFASTILTTVAIMLSILLLVSDSIVIVSLSHCLSIAMILIVSPGIVVIPVAVAAC